MENTYGHNWSMRSTDLRNLGLVIARARIALCFFVLLSIWVDPTTGGLFDIDRYMLTTLAIHLAYGGAAYFAFGKFASRVLFQITTVLDIVFASVLAFLTEGPTSPAIAMFLFAIIATGGWADFRGRVVVTLVSVAL